MRRRSAPDRRRRHLAAALDTALTDVIRPPRARTARVPVARRQVLDAQSEIEQLVAQLRDGRRRVDPDALLLAEEVLCDPDGPLFADRPAGALSDRLRLVRVALG